MEGAIAACSKKLKMTRRSTWMDTLKNELEKSHLASNLFFGLILALLEKLVELEFACPCNSKWNAAFACLFFILPGFLSFALMICIRGDKCVKNGLFCCIPFIMWLTLVFLDGQYFACAKTDWSGSYETVPQSAHLKWCKPDNTSEKTSELKRKTQNWFSVSQVIGMGFVGFLAVVTGAYAIIQCRKQNNQHEQHGSGPIFRVVEVEASENQESSGNANNEEIPLSSHV